MMTVKTIHIKVYILLDLNIVTLAVSLEITGRRMKNAAAEHFQLSKNIHNSQVCTPGAICLNDVHARLKYAFS